MTTSYILKCSRINKYLSRSRRFSASKTFSNAYESSLPETFYNDEQKQMQATLSKIIETEINPFVDEWEKREIYPAHQLFKKLGNVGLLGIDKDPSYGGLGLNFKYVAAILEELGNIRNTGVVTGISVQISMTQQALSKFGSEDLKKEFLIPSIAGDYVSCIGVSEPNNSKKQGDDLIINGQKIFITNGLQADWICLLCNTSERNSYKNKSLVCVPLNLKGVTRTKILKVGNNSSDTAQIFFEDVKIPAKNIIGVEGSGFFYQMLQFQHERLAVVLGNIKAMDNVISDTIEYTQQRKAFGKSILDNQVVHFRLAELATEVESLRALTYNAIDCLVRGQDVTRLASMAKLKCGRLGRIVADTCLQFYGGMGYTREVAVSKYFRDIRALSIGGGADEVMLDIITKLMNSLRKKN